MKDGYLFKMKFTFNFSARSSFGTLQAGISKAICEFLAAEKDFEVSFDLIKESKTNKQLRGIHRIIRLFALRLSEKTGNIISEKTAKELFKYQFGITCLASYDEAFKEAMKIRREKELLGQKMFLKDFNFLVEQLQRTFEVPKSLALLTKEEGMELLKKVEEEFVINRGWGEMVLTSDEQRAFNDYFNVKE